MTVKKSTKLFFFSTLRSTFIETDYQILRRHFEVEWKVSDGFSALAAILSGVRRNDIALAWFGSVYAFFLVLCSRLAKRPSMIIVAGADAYKEEELNYGIWMSPWKSLLMKYAYRHADGVLIVDPVLGQELRRLAEYEGKNIEYVPFGFDGEMWKPNGPKEPFIMTVAACDTHSRIKEKGLDKLMEAARLLPEVRFLVVGVKSHFLSTVQAIAPANVEIVPFLSQNDLLRYYQHAKVYCQVSFTEGMPNALCEAMLCECILVGTQRGGIPTVVGDTGFLISYGDVPAMVEAFRSALAMSEEVGHKARRRILEHFPIERRERSLLSIIHKLLS